MSKSTADITIPAPVISSRRRFLAATAVGSAVTVGSLAIGALRVPTVSCAATLARAVPQAVTIPHVRTALPDPVFALIVEKRAADVAHCEAIDAQDEAEGRYGIRSNEASEADDRCGAAGDAVNDIDWKLATTAPMTLAGVAAVLRFANEHEDTGGDWPNTDAIGPDGWHYQLRATMAAAIEALAGKAALS